jgi:hypothetical protein
MNPNRYDIWDVHQAAGQLQGQAISLSARHLVHGMARLRFNREVAYYARRIVNDVETGHTVPEQGIELLLKEHRSLMLQSQVLVRSRQRAISDAVKRLPKSKLAQPLMQPDPVRLLRFVHAQNLNADYDKAWKAANAVPPPKQFPVYGIGPPDTWPKPIDVADPGFYIVPRSTTAEQLEAQLFTSLGSAVIAKFRALNPGLDQVKAGQMIVLSDPENYSCTEEEERLMATAKMVNRALADLSPEEADFMVRHREEIESFIKHGSTGTSIAAAMFEGNLNNVKGVLDGIEELHKRTFAKHGHLRSPEFFAERKKLFARLDTHLTILTKVTIDYPDHPKLKTALGISSRSLVHSWAQAGERRMPPGYATHIDTVTKAAKYIKYGGWVGTAVGGGASYMKVQDVCTAGDAEACEKVKYTEVGGFAGGVVGGAVAGKFLGGAASATVCVGFGVASAGTGLLVCGLVVMGVGSFAGGWLGGKGGDMAGEMIYKANR